LRGGASKDRKEAEQEGTRATLTRHGEDRRRWIGHGHSVKMVLSVDIKM
jgi:hypothetical protein